MVVGNASSLILTLLIIINNKITMLWVRLRRINYFIYLFISDINIDFTSYHNYSRKDIFNYKFCEKSSAKLDGRSLVEW